MTINNLRDKEKIQMPDQKICADCGKKLNFLTKLVLKDGNGLCSKCKKNMPIFLWDYATEAYTLELYQNFKEYVRVSEEELQKIFVITQKYGNMEIDDIHGLFRMNFILDKNPVCFEFRYLSDFQFLYKTKTAEKGSFGGVKITGDVMLGLEMNNPPFYADILIQSDVKTKGKEKFFGRDVTYELPEGMQQIWYAFACSLVKFGSVDEDSNYNANAGSQSNFSQNRDEVQQAMSLFMIENLNSYTLQELKEQRNRLIKVFHPDENGEIDDKYSKRINEAYEVLKSRLGGNEK